MQHKDCGMNWSAGFPDGVGCEAVGPHAALITTRVRAANERICGLLWEVHAEGEREPLRYGLCLARAEDNFRVRVQVTGLVPGHRYHFQFTLDGEVSPVGSLRTPERVEVRSQHRAA